MREIDRRLRAALAGRARQSFENCHCAGLRAYVFGDDARGIDWAASARSDALQSRSRLGAPALDIVAVVDESASMRVGKLGTLRESADEAARAWFATALSDETRLRFSGLTRGLDEAARRAAPGAAVLLVSDFFEPLDERLLRRCAKRFSATALIARDPWRDGMPLRGVFNVRDSESGASQRIWFGARERAAYARACDRREHLVRERLRGCGWRTGTLLEGEGARSLYRAFGLA